MPRYSRPLMRLRCAPKEVEGLRVRVLLVLHAPVDDDEHGQPRIVRQVHAPQRFTPRCAWSFIAKEGGSRGPKIMGPGLPSAGRIVRSHETHAKAGTPSRV